MEANENVGSNEHHTKYGVLKTKEAMKKRKDNGRTDIEPRVSFFSDELKQFSQVLGFETYDRATFKSKLLAHCGVVPHEKPTATADISKDLKPFVEAIKNALDSGSVKAENFEERLKAMAKEYKLTHAQVVELKQKFPITQPKTQIVF